MGRDEALELERHSLHPWVRKRAELATIALKLAGGAKSCMEAGCGPCINLRKIKDSLPATDVFGVDISEHALAACKRRGIGMAKTDFMSFDPQRKYGAVLMLDFIEHMRDDSAVLGKAHGLLEGGGSLIMLAPAIPSLYSYHDKMLGHFRRYSKKELLQKASAAGFEPVFISYWNFLLFPAAAIFRVLGFGKSPSSSDLSASAKIGFVFDAALSIENWLISKKVPLPIGMSLFAVFKKKQYYPLTGI